MGATSTFSCRKLGATSTSSLFFETFVEKSFDWSTWHQPEFGLSRLVRRVLLSFLLEGPAETPALPPTLASPVTRTGLSPRCHPLPRSRARFAHFRSSRRAHRPIQRRALGSDRKSLVFSGKVRRVDQLSRNFFPKFFQRGAWCASRALPNHFFGLFPRRFRRATNSRLSCATRRARGGSNVRDGCETSSDVQSQRLALKTRASKSPSLVWRVTPCGCRSRRRTPFQSEKVENGRHHRRLSGADRHARGDSNVRNG